MGRCTLSGGWLHAVRIFFYFFLSACLTGVCPERRIKTATSGPPLPHQFDQSTECLVKPRDTSVNPLRSGYFPYLQLVGQSRAFVEDFWDRYFVPVKFAANSDSHEHRFPTVIGHIHPEQPVPTGLFCSVIYHCEQSGTAFLLYRYVYLCPLDQRVYVSRLDTEPVFTNP